MLDGFAGEVVQLLGSNPRLPAETVERIAHHVHRNIEVVNDLYAERVG